MSNTQTESSDRPGTESKPLLTIRVMKLVDLDDVLVIEAYSFPTPWTRGIYERDLIQNNRARFYSAFTSDSVLAGYIGSWFFDDEAHIGTIAVKREARRSNIARCLIYHTADASLREGVKYIILEVRISNLGAIALYEELSFKKVGYRKGYYIDTGEDAHLMMLDDLPTFLKEKSELRKRYLFDNTDMV